MEAIYADQGLARVANRVLRARRSIGSTLGAPLASLALATTSVLVASEHWRLWVQSDADGRLVVGVALITDVLQLRYLIFIHVL